VKKQSLILLSFATLSFLFLLSSCKKINEPTEIGDELIPPIDNINTFETFFSAQTNNVAHYENDSTEMGITDIAAIGSISNDPEFGQTLANAYFNISSSTYGTNPFNHRDSVIGVDSVVLQLAYERTYGDSLQPQTFRVFEIAQDAGFNDTTFFRYVRPDFTTTGAELGSKTFIPNSLNDSITLIRKRDTSRVANVLRIPISNTLADRFKAYDTTTTSNGGFRTDSIFKTLFKGLAVKADAATGNSLNYFDFNDIANTQLIFYFRTQRGGKIDTTSATFVHRNFNPTFLSRSPANFINGQANVVKRTPSNGWNNYLTNGSEADDKLYIQSAPGSYATIKIPSLDTFSNNIIHRAELILTRINTPMENLFIPPVQLFLDRLSKNNDSAYVFDKDLVNSAGLNFELFGGTLKSNQYRFNITRYVQDIVTNDKPNHVLRLHAPLRTNLYFPGVSGVSSVPVLYEIANGRVVLAGGNYSNPAIQARLRIVYSKI
jgi:hypothetical protein